MKTQIKTKKINSKVYKTIGELVVFNINKMPFEKMTSEIKKLKPKSKWATNKESASQQYTWYKSAIRSNHPGIRKLLKQVTK